MENVTQTASEFEEDMSPEDFQAEKRERQQDWTSRVTKKKKTKRKEKNRINRMKMTFLVIYKMTIKISWEHLGARDVIRTVIMIGENFSLIIFIIIIKILH